MARSSAEILDRAAEQLAAYFTGEQRSFELPISAGGDGARPYRLAGGTRSYGEVARIVRSSRRAVGGACRRNPLPIVVPCHRIVAAGGALGGYSGPGGLQTKQFLLKLEGACEADGVPFPVSPRIHPSVCRCFAAYDTRPPPRPLRSSVHPE